MDFDIYYTAFGSVLVGAATRCNGRCRNAVVVRSSTKRNQYRLFETATNKAQVKQMQASKQAKSTTVAAAAAVYSEQQTSKKQKPCLMQELF